MWRLFIPSFTVVYRILGSKTKNTVYSSFLSLTVEKTISYYYLLSLLVPIISYYSFLRGDRLITGGGGYPRRCQANSRRMCGRAFPEHVQEISGNKSGTCPGTFREMSGKKSGNFPVNFQNKSRKCPGSFREIPRKCPGMKNL